MATNPCSGRPWQTATAPFRHECAALNRRCALCGQAINYDLRSPHRLAFTVDHIIPRWAGGPAMNPSNWQPAHRSCNSSRGATEGNRLRKRRPAPTTRRTSLTW